MKTKEGDHRVWRGEQQKDMFDSITLLICLLGGVRRGRGAPGGGCAHVSCKANEAELVRGRDRPREQVEGRSPDVVAYRQVPVTCEGVSMTNGGDTSLYMGTNGGGRCFNMPHDDRIKCKDVGGKQEYHVMAPTLNYNTSPWSWSKCSRKYITEFLDTGYGECLLDEPVSRSYDLPSQLPGQLYNANKQCELMFGPGSQVCPYLQAGCDHVLNSKARKDKCGVCGGDNSSCKTLAGTFNSAQYGYNIVVRIPAGATNIDIRQHSYSGKPEDDNYLALSDSQSNFKLNGNFVVSMFKREIPVQGTVMEYSGSDTNVERINCSGRIEEELILQVLSVGNLHNPDVRYSFNIPIENQKDQFAWDVYGSWQECNKMCQGEKKQKAICIRKNDHLVVSDQRCENLPLPALVTESCNTDCELRWNVVGKSECSAKCGPGYKTQDIQCMKYSVSKSQSEPVNSRLCGDQSKPPVREACHGDCHLTSWHYSSWSQCLVTCGKGVKHRQIWCSLNEERLTDNFCSSNTKPESVGACELAECASWQVGAWGMCTVTCGHGYQMRAVKCVAGNYGETLDDRECNAAARPRDSQCSVTCGKGKQARYVSCRDTHGGVADESYCAHLPRPPEISTCFSSCGQWHAGEWSSCSSTCAGGFQRRVVVCQDGEGRTTNYCEERLKPAESKSCDSGPCPRWNYGSWGECPVACGEGVKTRKVICVDQVMNQVTDSHCSSLLKPPSSQRCKAVPCEYAWITGDWSQCSVTCGTGEMERRVECLDNKGIPSELCAQNEMPESKATCQNKECDLSTSCSDVQMKQGFTKDGEYLLRIKGKSVQIYCAEMQSEYPKEYVTLRSGQTDNYSEIYGYRLQNPYECPFNGSRRRDCLCRNDYAAAGYTVFYKIRLDVNAMQIITTDLLFTQTLLGRTVPFATAGDCYSAAKCPQAQFSINLTGTGLRVTETTKWMAQGNYATVKVHRSHIGTTSPVLHFIGKMPVSQMEAKIAAMPGGQPYHQREKFSLDTTDPQPFLPLSWFTTCAISVRLAGSQLIGGSASRILDPEISNVLAGGSALNSCSK
ncbi:ATS20 metalloproteinase, partial [Polypterus senegalus]